MVDRIGGGKEGGVGICGNVGTETMSKGNDEV